MNPRRSLTIAAALLAGCSLAAPSEWIPEDEPERAELDDLERAPSAFTGAGEHVASNDGDLCIYANDPPLQSGRIEQSTFEKGDVLVVQVTYPKCLSNTCDIDREAVCDILPEGSELLVEASFSYLPIEDELCTMDCGFLTATCRIGPLAAGSYDIVLNGRTAPLTVPSVTDACPIIAGCGSDADCPDGYCGNDLDGNPVCRPFAEEGEPCGGYMPPGMGDICQKGLSCVYDIGPTTDLPGTCRAPCETSDECDAGMTCATHPQGMFCLES